LALFWHGNFLEGLALCNFGGLVGKGVSEVKGKIRKEKLSLVRKAP